MNKNNQIKISGKIKNAFICTYEDNGKSIWGAELEVARKNHRCPYTVNIMASSEIFNLSEDYINHMVMVKGKLQSNDIPGEEGFDQGVYITAEVIDIIAAQERQINDVCLRGRLCCRPYIKMLRKDNLVSVFMLAVEDHERTIFIPCSVGDWAAMEVAQMEVGTELEVSGRLHRRKSRISVWVYQDTSCLRKV